MFGNCGRDLGEHFWIGEIIRIVRERGEGEIKEIERSKQNEWEKKERKERKETREFDIKNCEI